MPSIIYGGVEYIQVRHALYCKKCKDTIESKFIHDFKWCSCGAIGVDGGVSAGNHVLGDLASTETRSMYRATIGTLMVWLPQEIVEQDFNRRVPCTPAKRDS